MPKDIKDAVRPYEPDNDDELRKAAERANYEEILERKLARDTARAISLAAQKQNLQAIKKQEADTLANQAQCPHMKPMNGGSAIAGQHDHRGVYHWICQYCQKEWTGAELPPHLRIDMALVGGPHHGSL